MYSENKHISAIVLVLSLIWSPLAQRCDLKEWEACLMLSNTWYVREDLIVLLPALITWSAAHAQTQITHNSIHSSKQQHRNLCSQIHFFFIQMIYVHGRYAFTLLSKEAWRHRSFSLLQIKYYCPIKVLCR